MTSDQNQAPPMPRLLPIFCDRSLTRDLFAGALGLSISARKRFQFAVSDSRVPPTHRFVRIEMEIVNRDT